MKGLRFWLLFYTLIFLLKIIKRTIKIVAFLCAISILISSPFIAKELIEKGDKIVESVNGEPNAVSSKINFVIDGFKKGFNWVRERPGSLVDSVNGNSNEVPPKTDWGINSFN